MSLDVWLVRSDRSLTDTEYRALLRCMPSARRKRLAKQPPEAQGPALLAYGLLLALLRERTGWRALPETAVEPHGKPFFPVYPDIHFSLSHTPGAAAAAVSGAPVGVDIQRVRPVTPRMLGRLEGVKTPEAFFENWVRWEARAKRNGGGLLELVRREPPLEEGVFYSGIETLPGYAAGVAASERLVSSSVRTLTLEELLDLTNT